MFYNMSNFDKIMAGGGSVNNEVYCAITGEDADFLVSGDMGKFDYRLDLKKLTMPLLILVGRYDRIAFPHTLEERFVSLGACWAFSFQPVLLSVWRPVVLLISSGTRARPLTQSPKLGLGFCLFFPERF
jgi:pimeloyl-ACP methyl ester carboxylesterase